MTHTEALKLALEAADELAWMLTCGYEVGREGPPRAHRLISKIREFAAQPQQEPLSELEKDAVNLLFALHDAWPYVHRHCTIESNRKAIQALIVKHGDFADLHPPEPQRKPLMPISHERMTTREFKCFMLGWRGAEAAHDIKE